MPKQKNKRVQIAPWCGPNEECGPKGGANLEGIAVDAEKQILQEQVSQGLIHAWHINKLE